MGARLQKLIHPSEWESIQRMAYNALYGGVKASATSTLFSTIGTYTYYTTGRGVLRPEDYRNYIEQTYLKNVIAFRSICLIAQSVASVRWKLFKRQSDGSRAEITEHATIDLMRRPNPNESWMFIMIQTASYLALAGNAYWEKVAPVTGQNAGVPRELYVLRPDRVQIKISPTTGLLHSYVFELNGRKMEFEVDPVTMQGDVYQFKMFNPLNDWYGMGDTKPTSREIDTANMGIDFNMHMFRNEGRPGMVFEYPEEMGDLEFKMLEAKLKQKFGGPMNAGKNMVLTKGGKAHPYAFKPKEMDYIKAHEALARRIAIGYGVFPMLLGIPGEATFANFKEARQAFWEQTVIFYLNYIREEMNTWFFLKEPSIFFDYDLDDVPALEPKRQMLWDRAQKSEFLTINEKREMVGLEAVEDGDVILHQASLVPLGMEIEESPEDDDGNDDDNKNPKKDEEEDGNPKKKPGKKEIEDE